MALETATYISDLVSTNPVVGDDVGQGDDHLRLLKATIKASFPAVAGAVTPTHTELNYVDGVTSAIQTQIDSKPTIALASLTGRWIQLGTTRTISGTPTSVDFINGVSSVVMDSTYEAYLFELIGVLPTTDGVALVVRTTTDATNFDTSGYVGVCVYASAGAANPTSQASGTTYVALTSTTMLVGTASGEQGVYGRVIVYKPSAAARCHIEWQVYFRESSASSYMTMCSGVAIRDTAADVDGIQFLPSSSTLASGTIRMYGRTK